MSKIKIFIRKNLMANKMNYLNIAGLTLGMFTFMFIYLFVYSESNYDQFFNNSNDIYHVTLNIKRNGEELLYSSTPIRLAEEFKNNVSGIQSSACYSTVFETSVAKIDENKFLNPEILYVNPEFFEVFNYQSIQGDLNSSMKDIGNAVITQSAAMKFFGTSDVIGRNIEILHHGKKPLLVRITALIEDLPANSNIQFELACHKDDYLGLIGTYFDNWYFKTSQSYVKLDEKADHKAVLAQMNTVVDNHMNDHSNPTADVVHIELEKIKEKHFKKNYTLQHPTEKFISKNTLVILLSVGLITLVISWLNYINFMVFQSSKQIREICIRKINGSGKMRLFFMLLKESFLLSLIPVVLAIVAFKLTSNGLFRLFEFSNKNIDINSGLFWISILVLLIAGTFISAIYPIVRLTSAQPVQILKTTGGYRNGFKNSASVFTILQLSLSLILMSGIFLINNQLSFIHKQSLGFEKENLMVLPAPIAEDNNTYLEKMDFFKTEALKNPGIKALSASSSVPGKKMITYDFGLKNKPESVNKYLGLSVDEDYFKTLGVSFIAGKGFSTNTELRNREIIINKKLARKLGFENEADAVGQEVTLKGATITGVVENYNHMSLHEEIKPMIFEYNLNRLSYFMVNINPGERDKNIAQLNNLWNTAFSNSPFRYSFISTDFDQQYANEKRLIKVTFIFTIIALIITILGIIITSLNLARLRIKEIGIRKVNGARISEIMVMLNLDIIIWIAIAFVLAIPVTWFVMHKWLENFAYKTPVNMGVFLVTGLMTLVIALAAVSWQSIKAATRNPVEALRYE